jgi:xylulokinase
VAIGVDVGTTSVKVGLLDLGATGIDAGRMETASIPYPMHRPSPGLAEQDPADWTGALTQAWADLAARVGPIRIRSLGICSQVNTHVVVDADLRPLTPAITWQDLRAAPDAAALDQAVADRREALWGGPFIPDASFSLSRLAWLRRTDRATYDRARWVLSPKDFVVAALTGEVVTDPISPIGVVGPGDAYLVPVLDLVPGAARLVPPLRPFDTPAGSTRPDNPAGLPAGIPVAVGTMDAWGSVFGSGLVAPGRAMEVSGTSEIIGVASDRTVPTRGVISFPPVRDLHVHAGPTQAGGDALGWAARLLGLTIEELIAEATEARRDPQPVVFLPHLAGERAPLWNPDARGVFLGVTLSTERRHLALAVLEGVAFAARHLLEACTEAAGLPLTDVRLSGGGSRSDTWNAIKATVHRRPLARLATRDSGVLGAALLGLVAAGLETDSAAAATHRVTIAETVEPDPDPASVARLDTLYGVYRDTYGALEPLFRRLAAPGPTDTSRAD